MQGTRLGGSLRPCTLLHASLSHGTSSLALVNCGQRSLASSSVLRGENRNGSEGIIYRIPFVHRVWPRRDAERALGLGIRRHLTVVAAKRSLLTELQSLKEEADAGALLIGFLVFMY
jgi:hypothetical protein